MNNLVGYQENKIESWHMIWRRGH